MAIALRKQSTFEQHVPLQSRGAALARYRKLREISTKHHSEAMAFLSRNAILRQARRLGLAIGTTLVLDNMEELTLAFDLAIHTAPVGRTRTIDRYARSTKFASASDEAIVLEAMRDARFAIVSVRRRHPSAGLIVTDVFRGMELWLIDEGLETSLPDGSMFATRYFAPDRFAMTAGVGIPIDEFLLTDAIASTPQLLHKTPAEAIQDRRLAEVVYRFALADGIMEAVTYQDPGGNHS